jgi:hypothetical protein
MRAVSVVGLLVLLCPAVALAQAPQTAPAPASPTAAQAPRRGGDITRDDYIERAKRNAERRFDRMDADHDGVLTADERRAWREAHHRHHAAAAKPPQ